MPSPYKNPYGYSSTAFRNVVPQVTPQQNYKNNIFGAAHTQFKPTGTTYDVDYDIEEQPLELEDWMFEGSEPQYKPNPYEDLSYWTKYGKKSVRQLNRERRAENVDNRRYNANIAANTAKSLLKNAPLVDSVLGYYQTKRDTHDYSDIENAKDYALRPTQVYTYSPTHITGNMKFNPYDYTEQANKIQSQAAAAQNLVARQGRGNVNMLMAHINNLLSNTNRAAGDAYNKAWQANEAQRMAVAQENRRADEYNANADNTAAQSYAQARNLAATQDKTNGYNALNNYATQKYSRQQAHQARLAATRDEMISNLGTYGENAFNANEANTDQSYNYWKDAFGRLHYNGGKPYDYNLAFDNDIWQSVYDNASDDEKAKLNGMTRQQRRNYIVDKLYKANV